MHSSPPIFVSKVLYKEVNKIVLKHLFLILNFVFFSGGKGNILNNPSSGPHKIWLNSLKRKMTLTPAVLQSIVYTFWGRDGEKKKNKDSYPSMQVTVVTEEGSRSIKRPNNYSGV